MSLSYISQAQLHKPPFFRGNEVILVVLAKESDVLTPQLGQTVGILICWRITCTEITNV